MTEKKWITKTWAVVLLALICCLLWGSAFSGVKVGYEKFKIASSDWPSQMVFAGVRFSIAGIMALMIGSVLEKKILLPKKSSIHKIVVISFFQTVAQYFFYYIGLAHTTGVKAAIIVSANVFTAILISALLFKMEKLTALKIVGSIIGFAGIIVINLGGFSGGLQLNFLGDGFIFLCTVASGFSSVFMKKYSVGENPIMLSGWQFFFGGVVMLLFGLAFGGKMTGFTFSSTAVLLYLSFVSAAAYSLWATLLKYNPVSKVAVFGFMNPVCGVIISSVVLGEKGAFSLQGLLALVLVCLGIWIVNSEKEKQKN